MAQSFRTSGTTLKPIEEFWPLETDPKQSKSKQIKKLKKMMKEAQEMYKNAPNV